MSKKRRPSIELYRPPKISRLNDGSLRHPNTFVDPACVILGAELIEDDYTDEYDQDDEDQIGVEEISMEIDQDDEDEYCTSNQHHHAMKPENHIPLSVYKNINSNPVSQAFVGFYAADGYNYHKGNFRGLGARSTEFPFLYHLLKACGAKAPILSFRINNTQNKVYKAAKHAYVEWKVVDAPLTEAHNALGLPSSNIHDTIPDKAEPFLYSLDKVALVRLFLFWVAGDGYVAFTKVTNHELSYSSTRLYARDDKILPLLQKCLEAHGLHDCIAVMQTANNLYMLRVLNKDVANEAFLEAINTTPTNILHPKLKLLKAALESPRKRIPDSYKSTREPFHNYLQDNIHDQILCVLGQDCHSLHLYELNALLASAGFQQIQQVDEFRLVPFRQSAENLLQSTDTKTILQQLFCNYFEFCTKRVLADVNPVNYTPPTTDYRKFRCTHPGCSVAYSREDHLKIHLKTHDPNGKNVVCTHPGCAKKFYTLSSMRQHLQTHDENAKKIPCTHPGCDKMFRRRTDMRQHLSIHDPNGKNVVCTHPGCGKKFRRQTDMRQHLVIHSNAKNVVCTHPGCGKKFATRSTMQHHLVTHSNAKNVVCTHPGCGKRFKTKGSMQQHVKKFH